MRSFRPRHFAVHLLIALLLLFFTSPFVQELPGGKIIEGLLVATVLLAGLAAVAGRGSLLAGSLLAAVALVSQWAGIFYPWTGFTIISLLASSVFAGLVIFQLLAYVLNAREVDRETLCACIAGFLIIGLLYSMVYLLLATLDPTAFSFRNPDQKMEGFEAFYFSFVTLSTIGFGDVLPVSRVARMLSVMEAITGMFYVAVLVARIVSIYSREEKKPES